MGNICQLHVLSLPSSEQQIQGIQQNSDDLHRRFDAPGHLYMVCESHFRIYFTAFQRSVGSFHVKTANIEVPCTGASQILLKSSENMPYVTKQRILKFQVNISWFARGVHLNFKCHITHWNFVFVEFHFLAFLEALNFSSNSARRLMCGVFVQFVLHNYAGRINIPYCLGERWVTKIQSFF